ncbi:HAMP domain-containing histidine kinase, partial [Staphylococcus aureus]
AIAGFAEMIEAQMLGPVGDAYRDRAQVIRSQARDLLGAIDDLDLAARIDSAALSLVPGQIALRPVLATIVDDLAPLAELRGSVIALPVADLSVIGDRRAVERLLARLLATLVSASGQGERIGVHMALEAAE